MTAPILATKLYIPPPQPKFVIRPRLIERLNKGLCQKHGFGRKLTLISAPAGFGKTTLVSEWIHRNAEGKSVEDEAKETENASPITLHPSKVAWLSLDEGDNDPKRFLAYLIAALQTISPNIGAGVLAVLQSPQPPPVEAILTTLLNEITTIPDNFILVLDDYHLIDSQPVDHVLAFFLEHLPPQMHLVIATREDPQLPLARYRVRGQLAELRATDLRFTRFEAAEFFSQVMGLNLAPDDIAALEKRTEGWIAGLQLAALSMQGQQDVTSFIQSFTGSHHFVLDYLIEEVLERQPANIQTFLLYTSILDRLCGPLCDAVCLFETDDSSFGTAHKGGSPLSGQETLAYLQQANIFIIPLDNERRWYRYHHLFADLLQQRLQQHLTSSKRSDDVGTAELHRRASQWYEDNGLEFEAFQHAVAADDFERSARLVEGDWMPLHFRGPIVPVLNWLASLTKEQLDARPLLWVMYASALSMTGQLDGVEERLQSAEAALQDAELEAMNRNIIGHIAAIRALLAAVNYQVDTIIAESQRALDYLHPDNLAVRTATIWKMGLAYQLQGDRAAAIRAYNEAIAICQASGNTVINISASSGLGIVQETENQLHLAVETYQHVLDLVGDSSSPLNGEAYLGLARVHYQWNDLDAAQKYGEQSAQLAHQVKNIDRIVASGVLLARLSLSKGDLVDAASRLAEADQLARQYNLMHRVVEVAAVQVRLLLQEGEFAAAAHLAETQKLPESQARVLLTQGNADAALAILEPLRQQVDAQGWRDEWLKAMVLQAVALQAQREQDEAVKLLGEALAQTETEGFIRLFVDEGKPMAELLTKMKAEGGRMKEYIHQLLTAFSEKESQPFDAAQDRRSPFIYQPLVEPLSERELEILQLIAQGLSNQEISERLFLALSTVKGHNRKIYGKLQVQRRTEAVARARELGLV